MIGDPTTFRHPITGLPEPSTAAPNRGRSGGRGTGRPGGPRRPRSRSQEKMQAEPGVPRSGVDADQVAQLVDEQQSPAAGAGDVRAEPTDERIREVARVLDLADEDTRVGPHDHPAAL